jgi:hypothetical protein
MSCGKRLSLTFFESTLVLMHGPLAYQLTSLAYKLYVVVEMRILPQPSFPQHGSVLLCVGFGYIASYSELNMRQDVGTVPTITSGMTFRGRWAN